MLRLEAVARDTFHASVNAASEAITHAGGWVSGHSLLSDAMAVLQFEVPVDRLDELVEELAARGLNTELPDDVPTRGKDLAGRLTLYFSQTSGDLRREMPPFH